MNRYLFVFLISIVGLISFFSCDSSDNPHEWGFDYHWGLLDGAANYFNPVEQRSTDPGLSAQKEYYYPRYFVFDDSLTASFTSHEEAIEKYEGVYEVGYEKIASDRYESQLQMGLLDERFPRSEPTYRQWETLDDSTKADQIRRMQVYADMIDRMDQNIGKILRYLEERDELDNTLLMFASDNGASAEVVEIGDGEIGSMTRWGSLKEDWANVANTPFRMFKNYSHEGGTATPFIVHWPEAIPEGGQIDHSLLHFIDIMPTLVDVSGGVYPEQYNGEKLYPLEGVSLLPLLKGDPIDRKEPLFYEWNEGRAVQTENWKLVQWGDEWELYDRRTDLTEIRNLADEYPGTVDLLQSQWQEWSNNMNTTN